MIYLASSWRNPHFDAVVDCFEQWSIPIYNFKDNSGFNWSEIDPYWYSWNKARYIEMLNTHPAAEKGFKRDKHFLDVCEGLLLITPCGRSAHLELGYVIGLGKPTAIYLKEEQEPELMYKLAGSVITDIEDVMRWAERVVREG